MPTKRYEWTIFDVETAKIIDEMIDDIGQTNRGMSDLLEGSIGYNRIRDLRMQLKAPARLSEFIAICLACGRDPADVLDEVLHRAEKSDTSTGKSMDPQWAANNLDKLTTAAMHGNTEAEQQAYEEMP